MSTSTFSSREFNQNTGGAKNAANDGPVYITDRGKPSHVLLSFAEYQRLANKEPNIIQLLGQPAGIGDIEFDAPKSTDVASPITFD